MLEKPLVSVIIPAYNHERYVQETIKSIILQTYQNIEIIIIDDGSKDSTWEKINSMKAECEERFSRVSFSTKENSGTCETLNMLLEKSEGEYIYLIASDDIAKPHVIQTEVEFLEKNPSYALVVGDNELIDENGKQCYWDENQNNVYDGNAIKSKTFGEWLKSIRVEVDFSSDAFGSYETLANGNYIPNGYLIKKSIFEKIGFFTKSAPLEDYWLMLQISKYAKIKYLDEILFSYRWHSANTASQSLKMQDLTTKTIENESIILKEIDFSETLASFVDFIQMGRVYEKKGVKGIFEIIRTKYLHSDEKVVKVFGFSLYRKIKKK